jgi:hypothetical protein
MGQEIILHVLGRILVTAHVPPIRMGVPKDPAGLEYAQQEKIDDDERYPLNKGLP